MRPEYRSKAPSGGALNSPWAFLTMIIMTGAAIGIGWFLWEMILGSGLAIPH